MPTQLRPFEILNCDQVFDVLTRSGASRDASQEALARHLAGCSDCRELAHGIEPATRLFEDAMESHRHQPANPLCSLPNRGSHSSWRPFALFGSGALLALLVLGIAWQNPRPPFAAATPAATQRHEARYQPSASGEQWLAALHLPGKCVPTLAMNGPSSEDISQPVFAASEAAYDCCLKCHAGSSSKRPPLEAQAMLDRTCHVCHNY